MFPLIPLLSLRSFMAISLLVGTCAALRAAEPAASSADQRVKVLLITGIEYHNWRETAPQIAKQLGSCPDIEVRLDANFNVCFPKIPSALPSKELRHLRKLAPCVRITDRASL
jgi:hypothetical protein